MSSKSSLSDVGRNVLNNNVDHSDGVRYNIDFDRYAREKFGKELHVQKMYQEHVNSALRIKPEKAEPVVDIQAQQKERQRQQQMRMNMNLQSGSDNISMNGNTSNSNNNSNNTVPTVVSPTPSSNGSHIAPTSTLPSSTTSTSNTNPNTHSMYTSMNANPRHHVLPPNLSIPADPPHVYTKLPMSTSHASHNSINISNNHMNVNTAFKAPNPSPRAIPTSTTHSTTSTHSSVWKENNTSSIKPTLHPTNNTQTKGNHALPSNIVIPNTSQDRKSLLASFKRDVDRMREARTTEPISSNSHNASNTNVNNMKNNSNNNNVNASSNTNVNNNMKNNSNNNNVNASNTNANTNRANPTTPSKYAHSTSRTRELSSPPPKYRQHEGHAYAYKPTTSTTAPQDEIDIMLSKMEMREVKQMLEKMHVDMVGCIEKNDYYVLLKATQKNTRKGNAGSNNASNTNRQNGSIHRTRTEYTYTNVNNNTNNNNSTSTSNNSNTNNAHTQPKSSVTPPPPPPPPSKPIEDKELMTQRITLEVEAWARKKPLYILLNEVNGDTAQRSTDPLPTLTKGYRKAMLRIHPDKHMADPAAYVRATEMFKHITGLYDNMKKM